MLGPNIDWTERESTRHPINNREIEKSLHAHNIIITIRILLTLSEKLQQLFPGIEGSFCRHVQKARKLFTGFLDHGPENSGL